MKLSEIKLWKLNILDIMLIVVIVFFGGVFAITNLNEKKEGSIAASNNNVGTKFCYTIEIKALSNTSSDMLKVGDEVYDKVSGTNIGKIANIVITEAQGVLEKTNGEMVLAAIPNKIDVKLTIETEGTIKNGEYLANGLIRIMVGNYKEIKTKYLMCSGTISSIENK